MPTTTSYTRPRHRFARDLKRGDDVLFLGRRGTIDRVYPVYRNGALVSIRGRFVDTTTGLPWPIDIFPSTPVGRFEREEA